MRTQHFIVALMTALLSGAVPAHCASSDSVLDRAEKAYSQQRYEEAVGWLTNLLTSDPKNARAHNLLGLIYLRQQKSDLAESEYRKAIEANPKLSEAKYNLGIALFDSKKYREAEKYLSEAAEHERNPEYQYNLGLTYLKLGNRDKARQCFEKTLKEDPKSAPSHTALGRILQDSKKMDQAIAEYKKALEFDPEYAEAHNNLGVAYGDQGLYPESIAEFQLALKADPTLAQAKRNLGYSQAHTTLGMTYFKQGSFDRAFDEYKKALSIDPYFSDAYYNLALLYQKRGNLKAAIDHYGFALKLTPDNAKAHNNLGVAYVQSGRPDLAAPEFRQALKLNPNYTEAQDNLQSITGGTGQ